MEFDRQASSVVRAGVEPATHGFSVQIFHIKPNTDNNKNQHFCTKLD